jgi:hypothetical protein
MVLNRVSAGVRVGAVCSWMLSVTEQSQRGDFSTLAQIIKVKKNLLSTISLQLCSCQKIGADHLEAVTTRFIRPQH